MSRRMSCLLAAAMLALPLPAYADCAARIAAVEDDPSVSGDGSDGSGGSVRTGGGKTEHQAGGPAMPSESWFTDSEDDDKSSVLTHLADAKDARRAGDEQACLEAVGQAESALRDE